MRAVALAVFALAGCERAGLDIQNETRKPLQVTRTLRPENANGSTSVGSVAPGQFAASVWYAGEHSLIEIEYPSGRKITFQGEQLAALSRECPKHCILRVEDSGARVVKTDFFGQPKE